VIAVVYITDRGSALAARLARELKEVTVFSGRPSLPQVVQNVWPRSKGLVFIMATGIAVRTIAPLLENKYKDPAVVCVDETGRYAVSLVSGHLGGANELAETVARALGAEAVITTASDRMGLTAVDLWMKEKDLVPDPPDIPKKAASLLLAQGHLRVFKGEHHLELPPDFKEVDQPHSADLIISNRTGMIGAMVLRPRNLVLGVGCNRGTALHQFVACLDEVLNRYHLSRLSIRNLATIDVKKSEAGIVALSDLLGVDIHFFSKDVLNSVRNIDRSEQAYAATGAQGVCEPAALLSSGNDKLIVRKVKCKDITLALAEAV